VRTVEGLKTARYAESPWKKQKRGRGKRAEGLRYQARVGTELARRGFDVVNGPWIEFYDKNGRGFAQPDFVVINDPDNWIIVESKLSQTPTAFEQLFYKYLPLLKFLHPNVEFVPIQVCKFLRKGIDGLIIEDISQACPRATWHWLGH